MSFRTLTAAALVAGLALFVGHGTAQPPKAVQPAADKAPKLAELLAKRVSLEKPFEGKFKDAIAMLADKFDLPLILDLDLNQGGMGACDGLEDKTIKLPKLMNVRLDSILRLATQQADATFLVYPDYIRIVPTVIGLYETEALRTEGEPNEDFTPFLPALDLAKARPLTKRAVVNLSFKGATLTDVLDEIASASGANIALAPLVGEKANLKLTVRFANTPVDAAVRTICEMSELAVIEDANVLVVTTRERTAARNKSEEENRRGKLAPQAGVLANGQPFMPNWLVAQPGDLSAEVAKLKEQNEQLKKQVDELMKLVKKGM